TNLLSYSEELDQTEWLKTNAAQLPNSAISPDGTATADKLYEDNTTDYHTANQFGITVTSGVDYALSVYAKYAGDGVHLQIRVHGQGAGVAWCNFDLDNGITGNSGGTHLISQSIESVGDGWYRCVAIVQYPSGGSDEGLQLVLCQTPSTDSEIPTYLGDASSGIYVWGMQMEVGSVPTSYIYTGSGSATRTAETLQYPLTTPQTEGMAVVVLGGFSTTAPGTQGIVGFTAASTTSLAYRTSAATPVYASDGTNVSDTGAIANGSAVEAIAVRWGSATHTVGYRTSTGWTWDATPATYDGAWTSDNTLQVLKSLGEPYNLSTVAIYESDEGTSWIESEYPT
ncbi:MAG: hypothetical protein KJP04_10680, partial [Arenicella sp.]|nr:hypothetical protein [Arenicella sp.]